MAEDKELIRKRASFKGRLTAFANYLSTLDAAQLTSCQASELQLRLGRMEHLYESYDEVQLKIECETEAIELQTKERNEFESLYYLHISQGQSIINSFNKSNTDAAEIDQGSSRINNNKLVKLPTIQLPKFSGCYDNWLEFHDTFHSLIHSNDDMDKINKFHYLRASLEGTAAVVIQSIEFSSANYEVAWRLLCERFDNKRLLIQNHVSALFNINPIVKESSACLKTIIDQLNKNLRSLDSLGEPTTQWDTLLIYILTQKLDSKTYREWEEHKGNLDRDKPILLEQLVTFLRSRADLLETLELSRSSTSLHYAQLPKNNIHTAPKPKLKTMIVSSDSISNQSVTTSHCCIKCNSDTHYLQNCPKFLALSNSQRLQSLPDYKVCYNCLRPGHYANHCKKTGCKICKRKHHTLVHASDYKTKPVENKDNSQANNTISDIKQMCATTAAGASVAADPVSSHMTLSASVAASNECDVLLSTALVQLTDHDGNTCIARAVLDSGSTSCLITERLCQKLKLPTDDVKKSIQGINNSTSFINKTCKVPITSLNENFSTRIQCFVLPSITDNLPCRNINISYLNIPSDICLADPNFYTPAQVDLIIGADVFWDLLGSQRIKLGEGKPILFETRLGWLVSGPINSGPISTPIHCNFVNINTQECSNDDIQNQLMRFWQLDEVSPKSSYHSTEERLCEEHFVENTTRLPNGRFCVKIPLKQSPLALGDSYQRAKHCFLSLERRLTKQPSLKQKYYDFMEEYRKLGHMSELKDASSQQLPQYFLPHHGVLRESSSTSKLRVVFNGSSLTTSGLSLNNIQMIGPTIQDDLLSILLRFRFHRYVLQADIEKMYRQVAVHPDDRHLQQILWRDNPSTPIQTYQLNTITYGTASAPFLAIRCLKQIGLECEDKRIAEIIMRDYFVDDLVTGASEIEEALEIRRKVTAELASACMPLRKWQSNEPQLMSESMQSDSSLDLNIGHNSSPSKTLGLGWQTKSDELCFPIDITSSTENTKRGMLSVISQIFDPLGLLAPCIINMKMLMQKLWVHKLSWDDQLLPEVAKIWRDLISSLPALNNLRVPRLVVCHPHSFIDFHVFTDASQSAYGACLYVQSFNENGDTTVRLLFAKSRVTPIKPTTIPRLELCGALVGARLYEKAIQSLRVQVRHATFWTDSTIVLGWLNMLPSKLQPFVRNRVAEILEKTSSCTWRHVPTEQNPADHISRGVDANSIQALDMWWSGPDFLKLDNKSWPVYPGKMEQLPELRPEVTLHAVGTPPVRRNVLNFENFSNFARLLRSTAYALRFIKILKKQMSHSGFLKNEELNEAHNFMVQISQKESFPEYDLLVSNHDIPKNSPLVKFNIFLDENNLMRVGGRLHESVYDYDKKHPILIQSTHRLSKLLFDHEHKQLMHAGPQLLLATIRERYWPIGGRILAKACYRKCVRCTRMKGKTISPIMGNLPQNRVVPAFPFENVGVDYAGPISSISRQGRGCRIVKVYIAIFICFCTKAIHLELVGDLTSNCYLSALRRLISRRGKPTNVYSDNGTSFVGACNELSRFLKSNCDSLSETATKDGINFHFIPAYSPHFGGLWEAGVKSTKYHLQRVLGNCNLTYEELYTTLVQIEAILNSRPLTPLSCDPNDYMPLTPGHFLIGRPFTALPVPVYEDSSTNRLTRYQRILQLRQHFWTRWSKEYISELQQRHKWKTGDSSLKLDALVLLKEDNLPPLKWKLGRIVAVHPGTDGVVRVADVRTATGDFRRAFSKICPLLEPNDAVESDLSTPGGMFRK